MICIESLGMDRINAKILENILRKRVSYFVNETLFRYSSLAILLKRMKQHNLSAFLCGGVLRDVLLRKKALPRDIDIIVHDIQRDDLERLFSDFNINYTRFGGISILIKDWKVDIWPLSETWAFKERYVPFNNCFSDYTKTTFLNIEAVAVELFTKRGRKRTIYSKGFFDSMSKRVLEINLEENPDPEINITRAIYMSMIYHFALGPHLRHYISERSDQLNIERIRRILKNSYTMSNVNKEYIKTIFQNIKEKKDLNHRIIALREGKIQIEDTDLFYRKQNSKL